MSMDIRVDLGDVGFNDALSPGIVGAIEGAISTSLALIRDRWQTEAQNRLRSTRVDYLMGLQVGSIQQPYDEPLTGAVVLMGELPNAIEKGYGSFDMKVGFGNSPRIRRTDKGGWYLTIPLRHGTPGSSSFGTTMSKDVYGVASSLNPYKSGLGNTSAMISGAGDRSWNGYQHKSNINNGMVRIVKSYKNANQSMYYTFRRVSNNSDPMSWWHPGYRGAHIADSVEPYARRTFTDILSDSLRSI